jgi:hypothetical protein
VHDYEGTVNEMTGDGIMASFDAPIAVEEAPQRVIQIYWLRSTILKIAHMMLRYIG